jgi:hypothetical protein
MLGEGAGAQAQRGGINKIRPWGEPLPSGHGIKCKISCLVHCLMHNFYMRINPRQKLGNAVACASAAPMRLHCLICHVGINIQLIIAQQRKNGGEVLQPSSPDSGIIFRSAGRHPKKLFLKATARPQIRLWQKVTRNQK